MALRKVIFVHKICATIAFLKYFQSCTTVLEQLIVVYSFICKHSFRNAIFLLLTATGSDSYAAVYVSSAKGYVQLNRTATIRKPINQFKTTPQQLHDSPILVYRNRKTATTLPAQHKRLRVE